MKKIGKIIWQFRLPRQRLSALLGVGIIALAVVADLPVYDWLTTGRYRLDAGELAVIGPALPQLSRKLTLDRADGMYQFNASAKRKDTETPADIARRLRQNVTGNTSETGLYSLDMSINPQKGVTIYDNNSQLSFTLVPTFARTEGRKMQGRLVYPLGGGAKAVYTVKNNGMKEDLVFPSAPKDGEVSYDYTLKLPSTLQARLSADGSLGIYSADPNLFGNISYGSDADRAKVESARQHAPKDHLVFGIPAPVIKTAAGEGAKARASFRLHGTTLTLTASGLNALKGAFSIDPSVVVTSSSDFATGNDEGNISFPTDAIRRTPLSGGALTGTWNTVSALPVALEQVASVAANGYLYVLGGYTGSVYVNTVYSAQILSGGTLGSWATTTALPKTLAREGAVIANGTIYVVGGYDGTGVVADTYYAPIGAGGTVGTWTATTSMPVVNQSFATTIYRGFIYTMGGNNSSAGYTSSYYAPINADGTVGTWLTGPVLPQSLSNVNAVAYGDYIYMVGGYTGAADVPDVTYAHVNADGTLDAWGTTTPLPTGLEQVTLGLYGGCLYEMAGDGGSAGNAIVRYAPINADGTLGTWSQATSLPVATTMQASVMYQGNFYKIGGITPSVVATVYQNSVVPLGAPGAWGTTTAIPTVRSKGQNYGVYGHTSVAYNGYLYIIGGYQNGAAIANTYYAPINADGTVGTWTATTSLPAARYYHASVVYKGYVYVLGGQTTASTNTVLYAPLYTTGIGTWTTNTTSFSGMRNCLTAATYNGYLYVLAGYTGSTEYNDVQFAPINADASVGTWQYTYNSSASASLVGGFTTGRDSAYAVAMGGVLYLIGGWNGTTNYTDTQYAPLNADGTVGSWATTASLQTARHGFMGLASMGCIYVAGGGIGGADTATTEYACVNGSTGALGPWSYGQAFTNAREYPAGALYNGTFYMTGGFNGSTTYYSDTYTATAANGGSGAVGSWTSTTSLPNVLQDQTSVVSGGYLYVIGGYDNSADTSAVRYAPLNADGTVGSWATTTSLPAPRADHTSVVYNGYVYVLGGSSGTGSYNNTVWYAKVLSGGGLGSWKTTTAMTSPRSDFGGVVSGGYLYVIGGYDGSATLGDVQYAKLNADGTIGAWSATTAMTSPRSLMSVTTNNGYIYLLGGSTGAYNSYLATVEYAKVNPDGTLSSWKTGPSLSYARDDMAAAVYDGYLYVIGGDDGANMSPGLATVEYAMLYPNGALGAWTTGTQLSTARRNESAAVANGRLYVIGGYYNIAPVSNVDYATLQSIARKARYTKLVDLGSVTTLANISYTGSLSGGKGDIRFKVAGTGGKFGAWNSASDLTGVCGPSVTARYVLLDIAINDAQNSSIYDIPSTTGSMQDVTLDYGLGPVGVGPSVRLRGGKYFNSSEAIQPLDTLKSAMTCS